MKTLLAFLVLNLMPPTKSEEPAKWLKAFVRDAVAQQLSNTELKDTYFCTNMLHRTDAYEEKARKGMEWALTMQRPFLREKQLNLDEVRFAPYESLSVGERPAKPFHMLGETKNVYVAQYRGEIILYFLLQDDKIASTLLLGQGSEYYFIDFCR